MNLKRRIGKMEIARAPGAPTWEEEHSAHLLLSRVAMANLFAVTFYLPLLRRDHPSILRARHLVDRGNRARGRSTADANGLGREQLVQRIAGPEFAARRWDRLGPVYRRLMPVVGTVTNPEALLHPEQAAVARAAFEQAEVLEEVEAEVGRRIVGEMESSIALWFPTAHSSTTGTGLPYPEALPRLPRTHDT